MAELGVEVVSHPTLVSPIGSIRYTPNPNLTIRSILQALPQPITAAVFHPPSLQSISMKLQAREARKIARLFLVAALFTIPTFVVGIVGMVALPKAHTFRQHIERPVWGGASLGVIVLWALATPVQFGVGWWVFWAVIAGFILIGLLGYSTRSRMPLFLVAEGGSGGGEISFNLGLWTCSLRSRQLLLI